MSEKISLDSSEPKAQIDVPQQKNLYENDTKQYFTARPIQMSSWENLQKTVKFIILS